MKINHLYVDVRAKKLKTIGNSLKTCAPVEKVSIWLAKVQLGSDKRTSVLKFLALCYYFQKY